MHHARGVAIELHEYVVPDFDIAVAVFVGRSRRAARNVGAVIIKNLGAGAARAGIAHRPEIVARVARALIVADAHDANFRHADVVVPDVPGFVVFRVDRDP